MNKNTFWWQDERFISLYFEKVKEGRGEDNTDNQTNEVRPEREKKKGFFPAQCTRFGHALL